MQDDHAMPIHTDTPAAFGFLKLSFRRIESSEVRLRPCALQAASNFFSNTGETRTKTGIGAGAFFFNLKLL